MSIWHYYDLFYCAVTYLFLHNCNVVECMENYIDLLKTFLVSIYSKQYNIDALSITTLSYKVLLVYSYLQGSNW
jgi:hypothetical protein